MPKARTLRNRGAAVLVVAAVFTGGWEGLQTVAYPDPATRGEPWTICFGETSGVKRGDRKSVEECRAMLSARLEEFSTGVANCLKVEVSDERMIALTSFAYNVGVRGACKSSVIRHINAGRPREGCDALLAWNKAAGLPMRGLTRRRVAERELCLRGLA